MDSISRPVTEFCLDLYKKLNRSAEDTNIVFSPMSISVALALIHLGARNNTAAQIEEVSMDEPWWGASTLLAVPLMEMLGIPAWHTCEFLTENLHKGRHTCCLHSCAWSTVMPAIWWCDSHHSLCKITEKGLTEGRWHSTVRHSSFPQTCWQNIRLYFRIMGKRFLLWLLWESWEWECGRALGRAADTWRGCTWVAGSLAHLSHVLFESQNVEETLAGKEEVKKATPPVTVPLLPAVQVLFSTAFLLFSFFLSFFLLPTMNGKRPTTQRQKISPGCGGLTFAVAARCPPRHSLRICSLCTEMTPAASWLP